VCKELTLIRLSNPYFPFIHGRYVNAADKGLNVIYSTPSCYLKAVNDEGLTYSTKQDDFFPYGSDYQTYWTGYFTSRPTSKYFERLGNNFLQVTHRKYSVWGNHHHISLYLCVPALYSSQTLFVCSNQED
jgi:hypothetical protein